ncbi:hypothetical protein C8A05DRAFT_37350 [Staphylotrichum tortipilum]|uniref:Uncharacterized protein n=1 Tax=Staphylotrichum tortipilum TaxID=2831512 RepID=A0AAN6RQA2_9PEZI|nr:hypothetical protein C8A05DRAFT_37350 [Staphylotrichum longicolle]
MATHTITQEVTAAIMTVETIADIADMPAEDPTIKDLKLEGLKPEVLKPEDSMPKHPKPEEPTVEHVDAEHPEPEHPTAVVKNAGCKRGHPDFDYDTEAPDPMPPTRALLLHLCTLLDCREAVTSVVRALITALRRNAHAGHITDDDIMRAFTTNSYMPEIFVELGLPKLEEWEVGQLFYNYESIYRREALPRFRVAPGAMELIQTANQQEHMGLVAAVTNNPVFASGLLGMMGFGGVLSEILPTRATGPRTYVAFAADWHEFILPAFARATTAANWAPPTFPMSHDETTDDETPDDETPDHAAARSPSDDNVNTPDSAHDMSIRHPGQPAPITPPLLPSEVTVVSRAVYELDIAKSLGMRTCWVRDIDEDAADTSVCDVVVAGLDELRRVLFGPEAVDAWEVEGGVEGGIQGDGEGDVERDVEMEEELEGAED